MSQMDEDVQGVEDTSTSPLWYFAYGANMSSRVLRRRRRVFPRSSEAARLDGFRLTFSEPGIPLVEPVFANIEPDNEATVHGVLHQITRQDLSWLDQVEGADYAHIRIEVEGRRAGPVEAHAYRNPHPVSGYRPSRRYLELLCEGAREYGLPREYVSWLEGQPSVHVPLLSYLMSRSIGLLEWLRRRGVRHEVLAKGVRHLQRRMTRRFRRDGDQPPL